MEDLVQTDSSDLLQCWLVSLKLDDKDQLTVAHVTVA